MVNKPCVKKKKCPAPNEVHRFNKCLVYKPILSKLSTPFLEFPRRVMDVKLFNHTINNNGNLNWVKGMGDLKVKIDLPYWSQSPVCVLNILRVMRKLSKPLQSAFMITRYNWETSELSVPFAIVRTILLKPEVRPRYNRFISVVLYSTCSYLVSNLTFSISLKNMHEWI